MSEPDFKNFADEIINDCLENFMSMGYEEIERLALKYNLLTQEAFDMPCSDNCACEELGTGFPIQCNRKNYSLHVQQQPKIKD